MKMFLDCLPWRSRRFPSIKTALEGGLWSISLGGNRGLCYLFSWFSPAEATHSFFPGTQEERLSRARRGACLGQTPGSKAQGLALQFHRAWLSFSGVVTFMHSCPSFASLLLHRLSHLQAHGHFASHGNLLSKATSDIFMLELALASYCIQGEHTILWLSGALTATHLVHCFCNHR